MGIIKNAQFGKTKNVLIIDLGAGDVEILNSEVQDGRIVVAFKEHGEIHKIDIQETSKWKSFDEMKPPVILRFSNPKSIDALIHQLEDAKADLLKSRLRDIEVNPEEVAPKRIVHPDALKPGQRGIVTHWVNQPQYIGNAIRKEKKLIITTPSGIDIRNIDMRYPHLCYVELTGASAKELDVERLGFHFVKHYSHDQFYTNRYEKGFLTVEFTYESYELMSFDVTVDEVTGFPINLKDLKHLDNLLNQYE